MSASPPPEVAQNLEVLAAVAHRRERTRDPCSIWLTNPTRGHAGHRSRCCWCERLPTKGLQQTCVQHVQQLARVEVARLKLASRRKANSQPWRRNTHCSPQPRRF